MRDASRTLSLTTTAFLLLAGGALAQSSQPAPDAAARAATAVGSPVVGLAVKSADNQSVGTIDNVIIGHDGRVQNLVISVGGVLGVGAKDVVVSWNDLTIDTGRNEAIAAMSKDELKRQPEFHGRTADSSHQNMIPLPKRPAAADTAE